MNVQQRSHSLVLFFVLVWTHCAKGKGVLVIKVISLGDMIFRQSYATNSLSSSINVRLWRGSRRGGHGELRIKADPLPSAIHLLVCRTKMMKLLLLLVLLAAIVTIGLAGNCASKNQLCQNVYACCGTLQCEERVQGSGRNEQIVRICV